MAPSLSAYLITYRGPSIDLRHNVIFVLARHANRIALTRFKRECYNGRLMTMIRMFSIASVFFLGR
jgi:hypothetical protein